MSAKSHAKSPLTNAKNLIRGFKPGYNATIRSGLEEIRRSLPPNQYAELFTWARQNGGFTSSHFPKKRVKWNDLFSLISITPLSLKSELEWCFQCLLPHVPALSGYSILRSQLALAMLRADYSTAEAIQETIEREHGTSVWLLKTKFALTQHIHGLASQKKLLDQVLSEVDEKTLVTILATQISERNEDAVVVSRFVRRFVEIIGNSTLPRGYGSLLIFHVTGTDPLASQMPGLFTSHYSSSYLDLWEIFIEVLAQFANSTLDTLRTSQQRSDGPAPKDEAFRNAQVVINYCKALSATKDSRLQRILVDALVCTNSSSSEIFHLLETTLSKEDLDEWSPNAFVSSACFSDSMPANYSSMPIAKELWNDLRCITRRETSNSDAMHRLYKFTINHQYIASSKDLLRLAGTCSSPFLPNDGRRYLDFAHEKGLLPINFLLLDPQKVTNANIPEHYAIPTDLKELERLIYTATSDADAQQRIAQVKHHQRILLLAHAATLKDWHFALEVANEHAASAEPTIRAEALKLKVWSLINKEDWVAATGAMNDAIAMQPTLSRELPYQAIFLDRDFFSIEQQLPNLDIAIGLYHYLEAHEDDNATFLLQMYIRCLLERLGLQKPSELGEKDALFDLEKLTFFLSRVCVRNNYEALSDLATVRQAEEERLAVCQLLLELDPKNSSSYTAEIRDITARLALDEGFQVFDKSRIYVDIQGIKRWTEKNIADEFERFKALKTLHITSRPSLRDILKELEKDSPSLSDIELSLHSEADNILLNLFKTLYTQFLTNTPYGLDMYLSLRIRHGSLSNEIRNCLEVEKLISEKDSVSGKYRQPDWLQKLDGMALSTKNISDAYQKFCTAFDLSLNQLLKEKIQIRSASKKQGMLDVTISSLSVAIAERGLTNNSTLDDLVETCVGYFYLALKEPLSTVRAFLTNEFKTEAVGLIDKFYSEVNEPSFGMQASSINSQIIRARTAVTQAIDRVAKWFAVTEASSLTRTYTAEEIISIAVEATKKTRRGFTPNVTTTVDQNIPRFASESVPAVIDALFIMLDNVYRHSGLHGSIPIELNIQLGPSNSLQIECASPISEDRLGSEFYERLQRIRDSISADDSQTLVAAEGGTGLLKLSRMNTSGAADGSVTFEVKEGNRFFVSAVLKFFSLPAPQEENHA